MTESVTHLKREVIIALKHGGRVEFCLHEHEFDFLKELVKFLKSFKNISDLFSSLLPTLSLIALVKTYIHKNCHVSVWDDKIKLIKGADLHKLDVCFPVTDAIKLHRVLDPLTKDVIPRAEVLVLEVHHS